MEKSFTLNKRDFMDDKYAFVMMIKDKWWREFLRLRHKGKQVQSYVQNGWAPPKNTSLLFFYVSKPVGEIAGHAEFVERKTGDAESLWKEHGSESVLQTKEKYEEFTRDMQRVSFIRFKNLQAAAKPIPLNNFLMLLGVKRLARGGFYVDKETAERIIALME
jgi:predicted transcriptional regulator